MANTNCNDIPCEVIQEVHQRTRDELISLTISIANRRIIVALCENDRGRYIKLTDGRSRIFVPSSGIVQLREALSLLGSNLNSFDTSLENSEAVPSPHALPQPSHQEFILKTELIDSQRFLCEGRKFYLDVLKNSRGRFLKISQASNRRITLVVSLTFIPQLRRAIDMVIEKAPPDNSIPSDPSTVQRATRTLERAVSLNDGSSVTVNVVQREIRVFGKRIVFESAANRRGSYLKIMENIGSNSTVIMLPHSAVQDVIHALEEAVADGDPSEGVNICSA